MATHLLASLVLEGLGGDKTESSLFWEVFNALPTQVPFSTFTKVETIIIHFQKPSRCFLLSFCNCKHRKGYNKHNPNFDFIFIHHYFLVSVFFRFNFLNIIFKHKGFQYKLKKIILVKSCLFSIKFPPIYILKYILIKIEFLIYKNVNWNVGSLLQLYTNWNFEKTRKRKAKPKISK